MSEASLAEPVTARVAAGLMIRDPGLVGSCLSGTYSDGQSFPRVFADVTAHLVNRWAVPM